MPGAMEAAGALKVVKRALDKSNLRYVSCIGDPYISSFNEVNNSKPYNDFKIIRKECAGHVQKRLSAKLKTL